VSTPSPETVQRLLQDLLDRVAIQDVLLRYAQGVDRRDLAQVASCFTPDAAYAGALGTGSIGDALAQLAAVLPKYVRTLHFLGNHSITIAGDTARSETYALAHHLLPDGRQRVVAIRYLDDLVRGPDGWQIARRNVAREWERTETPA
jgi:ketosteroid isomerase-like protein